MRFTLPICILFLYLCSCIRVSDAEKDARIVPTGMSDTIARAIKEKDFFVADWPSPTWWEMFGDPQLVTCIQQAIENSPSIPNAQARLNAAQQVQKQRGSWLFPTLDGNFEYNWQKQGTNTFFRSFGSLFPATINQFDLKLDLNYNIDFWGKYRNSWRSAQFATFAEQAEYAQVLLTVTAAVAGAYFELQSALVKMMLYEELKQEKEEILALLVLRLEKGLNPEMNSLEARKELQEVLSQKEQLRQQIVLLEHQLAALMGKGPDNAPRIVLSQAPLLEEFPLPNSIALDLVARRPDLRAQILRAQAAAYTVGAKQADFYPSVDLTGFIGFETVTEASLLSMRSGLSSLAPAVNLPIFNAGRIKARVDEARALYDQSIFEYNQAVVRAAKEVADELTLFHGIHQQISFIEVAKEMVAHKKKLSQERFDTGVSNYFAVVLDRVELTKTKMTLKELQYMRQLAAVRLIKALGGGYQE